MGRWQREALSEGLWREVAAPPPPAVPLPIAARQGGSATATFRPKPISARYTSARGETACGVLHERDHVGDALRAVRRQLARQVEGGERGGDDHVGELGGGLVLQRGAGQP